MMADLRSRVRDPADPEQARQYLTDLLAGRAYVPMDRRQTGDLSLPSGS